MSAPRFLHGRIFFEDWSICDPEHLRNEDGDPGSRLHHALHPMNRPPGMPLEETVTISRADALWLAATAEAYVHLTTHPAGTESMVKQLREIRRALVARRAKGKR